MGKNSTDLEFPQYIRQASIPQQDRARHPCTGTNSQHQWSKQQPIAANRREILMGATADGGDETGTCADEDEDLGGRDPRLRRHAPADLALLRLASGWF